MSLKRSRSISSRASGAFDGWAVESPLQFTLKVRAIGQAGQAVVSRLVCQLEVLPGETIVDRQNALGDLQTKDQLVLAGRLGKEIVGAGAEPLEPVISPVACRQQDDVGILVAGGGTNPATEIEPVEAGHHPVSDQNGCLAFAYDAARPSHRQERQRPGGRVFRASAAEPGPPAAGLQQ